MYAIRKNNRKRFKKVACIEKGRAPFPGALRKGSTEECVAYSNTKRSILSLGTDIFPDEDLCTCTREMGF